MVDLTKAWPGGLGRRSGWWVVAGAIALLAIAAAVDVPVFRWVQTWPDAVRGALAEATPYGESDWILLPSGVLFVMAAAGAMLAPRRLLRTLLWQFAVMFGFIFAGVGAPSLVSTLVKRLIGRARPVHIDDVGPFAFHWNWADWTYQSFPSGHATTAFALAMVLGFILPRWFYPALIYAIAICVSRVALGVHYPSDVTAGAIVGVLGAYCVRWVFVRNRWLFAHDRAGRVAARPPLAFARWRALRRRDSAPAPPPGLP